MESKGQRNGGANVMGRRWFSQLRKRENLPFFHLLFCLGHSGGWMSLLIQMLISSRNTLTDMPRNDVLAVWASLSPVN